MNSIEHLMRFSCHVINNCKHESSTNSSTTSKLSGLRILSHIRSPMKMFGIEFAPLNVPMKRRLETLTVATTFIVLIGGGFIAFPLAFYVLIFTSWRWLLIPYLIWIFIDDKTSETGGRRSHRVRNSTWWKLAKNYFPINLERTPGAQLDPNKNYLFCCFPHGVLSASQLMGFTNDATGFRDLFPSHTPYAITLKLFFRLPVIREIAFAMGACDASANSINYLLGRPDGGNVVVLTVGGVSEAFYSRPGTYRINLKNRKGFVKLAMKNGAPLVPVVCFGEPDLCDQVSNPKGSMLRAVQELMMRMTGFAPIIPVGRGIFQYTYGMLPRRKPLTTLVGRPMDVEKVESATTEQIDDLHAKFAEELTRLFEEHKHLYIENADDTRLEIE